MDGAFRGSRWLPLLVAMVGLCMSASALNTNYLLPGGDVKVSRTVLRGKAKFCALTFDDGPDARYTLQVAEILETYDVAATFFVVGSKVERFPDQVVALAAAGHEIGNHSYDHPDFTKISAREQMAQIDRTTASLTSLGIKPHWFRPPSGAFNARTVKSCKGCGLMPVLWSVDPRDWDTPGVDKITSRVMKETGNGAVILLHSTNAQTVAALPAIIEGLRKKGYEFLTMTQWAAAAAGKPVPELEPLVTDRKPALPDVPQFPSIRPPGGDIPIAVELRGDSLPDGVAPLLSPAIEIPSTELPQGIQESAESLTQPTVPAILLPDSSETLDVYSNFSGPAEVRDVLREHAAGKLRKSAR